MLNRPAVPVAEPLEDLQPQTKPLTHGPIPWIPVLFLLTVLMPVETSVNLGALRLTPYRVLLLFTTVPCIVMCLTAPAARRRVSDYFMLLFGGWLILSLCVNHGADVGAESGGILVIEAIGSYFLARTFIKNERDFYKFAKITVWVIIGLSVVTIPEAVTGIHFLRPGAGGIGGRMGLVRAYATFEHPILYGVFCASGISLAWFVVFGQAKVLWKRFAGTGMVIVSTLMSVSSGPLAAVTTQLFLIAWRKVTERQKNRWTLLCIFLALGYIVIAIISTRPPIRVLLHRLTFSAHTAYNRMTIWNYGIDENVVKHPIFGIGFNDWSRPSWMHSASVDNFWLVNMMRYGLPTFGMLAIAILILMLRVGRNTAINQQLKMGWMITMVGMIIVGSTVHFWNQTYVWFFFLVGSGACLAVKQKPSLPGGTR